VPPPHFINKFIAFIDILGFKKIVEDAEKDAGIDLAGVLKILKTFGNPTQRDIFEKDGATICPNSRNIQRNLDFRLTQVSDSSIISTESSPAGLINLINHCYNVACRLLRQGILCRGYITKGSIFHDECYFIGTGYHEACENEKDVCVFKNSAAEGGTPYIEISPEVVEYLELECDDCIKKIFGRLTIKACGAIALSPFNMLTSILGQQITTEEMRNTEKYIRSQINEIKMKLIKDAENAHPKAKEKINHYIRELDNALKRCDQFCANMDILNQPFPRNLLLKIK
jgi:hypothetical protein